MASCSPDLWPMCLKTDKMYFQLEGAQWLLEFGPQATALMEEHAQTMVHLPESVGQLYTRDLTSAHMYIEHATLLLPRRASRGRVQFDTKSALAERELLFRQGLHCVGIWHTHPEPRPSPSSEDRSLAKDFALAAQPALTGVIFVIVGTLPSPHAYSVWVADGKNLLDAKQKSAVHDTNPAPQAFV